MAEIEVREVDKKLARDAAPDRSAAWLVTEIAEEIARRLAPERARAARVEEAARGVKTRLRERREACTHPTVENWTGSRNACPACAKDTAVMAALDAALQEKP